MAKDVARDWISNRASEEHRLTIYYSNSPKEVKGLVRMLRLYRDGQIRIDGVDPIPNLGIASGFDSVVIWSSDGEKVSKIKDWVESRGYETSGVW